MTSPSEKQTEPVRRYTTGATRDLDQHKFDYEGFLSPVALFHFAMYMHKNRQTAAGVRDSDNWQKGIPLDSYMKSMFRHFMALWSIHRGLPADESLEDALGGLMFNVQGYMHETYKPSTMYREIEQQLEESLKGPSAEEMAKRFAPSAPSMGEVRGQVEADRVTGPAQAPAAASREPHRGTSS